MPNFTKSLSQLGNIIFIGELFKERIIGEGIMHECVRRLIECAPRRRPSPHSPGTGFYGHEGSVRLLTSFWPCFVLSVVQVTSGRRGVPDGGAA